MNPKLFLNSRIRFVDEPADGEPTGGGTSEPPEPKADSKPEPKPESKKRDPEDELPSWAKEELSRTRREAARYRTERNSLRDQFKDAKTPDEVQALVTEYETKAAALEMDITRERVARSHSLPDELAELLKGSTEDELATHAKTLQKYAQPPRGGGDPKGGLDPSDVPDDYDPKAEAEKVLRQF